MLWSREEFLNIFEAKLKINIRVRVTVIDKACEVFVLFDEGILNIYPDNLQHSFLFTNVLLNFAV